MIYVANGGGGTRVLLFKNPDVGVEEIGDTMATVWHSCHQFP